MNTSPKVEIVTANKPMIDELRALDTHNRGKIKRRLEYLRREIREGRFTLTNQGVGVTVSNWICDGGHRLEAIALEEYPPVQFVLITGLPDEAQNCVDLHAKRSMHDILSLFFDEKASISKSVIAAMNVSIKCDAVKKWTGATISPHRLIDAVEEKAASISFVRNIQGDIRLKAAVLAAFIDVFHETSDEKISSFMQQVISGEMLHSTDPALSLRNWLLTRKQSTGTRSQADEYARTKAAALAYLERQSSLIAA